MSALVEATVRVSIVVLASLGVAWGLRRRSAALRHWVLAAGLASAAVLPLLGHALPPWQVGVALSPAPERRAAEVTTTLVLSQAPAASPHVMPPPAPQAADRSVPLASVLLSAWLAGVLVSLSSLLVGLWRLAGNASAARPFTAGTLAALAVSLQPSNGWRRPVTLLRGDGNVPLTWGTARPTILLPADAESWPDDRARIVLRHELAHVARGDWAVQLMAEIVRAVHWFNPLVWIACRRLRDEGERACDDVVLNAGVDATDYASHLLELARQATRPVARPVLAVARRGSLEGRVRAMLNTNASRRPIRNVTRFATLVAFAALTIPVAIAQNRFSTLSGTVADQTNRSVPEASVVLVNAATQMKYEIRTDATGHFQLPGLPSGDYQLAVMRPGFKTLKESITVAGKDLARTLRLQIGTVQETIHVSGPATEPTGSEADRQARLEKSQARAQAARQRASEQCGAGPTAGETGGRILAPLKLTDVRPAYPASLQSAGIGGTVTLDATIGTDGTVRDVSVVSSPNPELERLAADAVRQWQFTTTYLNCTPVEVPMQVTVAFGNR